MELKQLTLRRCLHKPSLSWLLLPKMGWQSKKKIRCHTLSKIYSILREPAKLNPALNQVVKFKLGLVLGLGLGSISKWKGNKCPTAVFG